MELLEEPATIDEVVILESAVGESNIAAASDLAMPSSGTDIDISDPHSLDDMIRSRVSIVNDLARAYIELAALLTHMRQTDGYYRLNFKSWEDYLRSLDLGRTYISLLVKIGRAGDLMPFVERGMPASKLVEYAKHVGRPEHIPEVIEATFEEVTRLPVRKAGRAIAQYVAEHDQLRKPLRTRRRSQLKASPEVRSDDAFTSLPDAPPSRAAKEAVVEAVPGSPTGNSVQLPSPGLTDHNSGSRVASIAKRLFEEYMQLPVSDRRRFVEEVERALEEMRN